MNRLEYITDLNELALNIKSKLEFFNPGFSVEILIFIPANYDPTIIELVVYDDKGEKLQNTLRFSLGIGFELIINNIEKHFRAIGIKKVTKTKERKQLRQAERTRLNA